MLKIIPLSVALLLSAFSVYAQDNGDTSTTITTPGTTTPDTSTDNNNLTTPDTSTPATTNGVTNVNVPGNNTTTVAPTPVNTTPTPMTTTPVTTAPSTTSTMTTTSSTTSTSTTSATSFVCMGNTPNWNLNVSKDLITYSSSKNPNVKIKGVLMTRPMGDTTGNLQVFTAKDNNNRNVTILINRNAAGCVNGAPGQSYGYDAFIVFPTQVVVGCCNPQ